MKIIKTPSKVGKIILPVIIFSLLVFFAAFAYSEVENVSASSVGYSAQNNAERIAFLKSFKVDCKTEPSEIREVVIPTDFSGIFDEYQAAQIKQGFSLEELKGCRVKRFTYDINGENDGKCIAEMLVKDGKIVAAARINLENGGIFPLCK